MEGIYLGKVKRSRADKDSVDLFFVDHRQDIQYFGNVIEYDDTAYCLVPTDDIIINNDELLRLRDEVKELKIQIEMLEASNTGWAKNLLAITKNRDYFEEKADSVEKKYEELVAEHTKLQAELNEAKAKVADLEKKLADSKSKEEYWRDRKEEEEDCHHYWHYTFDRAVKQAAEKGVYIAIAGKDDDCNAGIVVVENKKTADLESQVIQMEDVHNKKWSAMTEALKEKGVEVIYMGEEDGKPIIDIKVPEWESDKQWVTKFAKQCADIIAEKFRLEREKDELKEQCDILRKDYVVRGQEIGDLNAEIDKLKKELEKLKSRTLDNVEIRLSYGDIMWTYCDGFVHLSSKIDGIISADQITTGHINCLCKNHVAVDTESISHGTVPKCSSCAHYVSGSRSVDIWCHKPISKEGPGTIRRLSTEEAGGPACVDFKAKE